MDRRTVFVVNGGVNVGSALARGLAARGHRVALLDDGGAEAPAGVERVPCSFGTRAVLEAAFVEAVARCGPPDQVAVSVLPMAALQAREIQSLDLKQWHATCREAIKALMHVLQAAFTQLGERGGSVVALGPALSLPGAGQLVALSAAVEGQRGLVKSAARQWGRRGLTVNWVAAAPRALSPLFETLPLPVKPDAVMVALGRGPALDEGLAGVVDYLGSPDGRALTGATLMADGGEWMVP
ncbi:SDR family oxidoreductase [Aquincola sp. S2]|uniref:SDR family oxidoreductase n=1 Tax=Pseudaquabacterium terrae TaxID=2732868 RepID=A0ABX2EU87_9BURK|nr:SDR family oxidoreductase [Aquabacterium terrae]NRF71994.1 SDR family oxidoreductase [Aquabacterium terrae]